MCSIHHHRFPLEAWAVPHSHRIKRLKFDLENSLPGIKDIRKNLGPFLSDIFFQKLPANLKEDIGYEPILEGPKESLWCSPSQQLIGNLRLEPCPRRQVQALQHGSILDIGEELEQKLDQLAQQRLEEAVAAKEKEMRENLEDAVSSAIKNTRTKIEEICRTKIRCMKDEFERKTEALLAEKERQMKCLMERKIEEALGMLSESVQEEMKISAAQREMFALESCKFTRLWDANLFNENYKKKINFYRKKWLQLLRKVIKTAEKNTEILQTKLDAEFAGTLQSMMIEEKIKTNEASKQTEEKYKDNIKELNKKIDLLKEENIQLKKMETISIDTKEWYCIFAQFLREFQKFINFVLQERPGGTEYLITLEDIFKGQIAHDEKSSCKDLDMADREPTLSEKSAGHELPEKEGRKEVVSSKVKKLKKKGQLLSKSKPETSKILPLVEPQLTPAVSDATPREQVASTLAEINSQIRRVSDSIQAYESRQEDMEDLSKELQEVAKPADDQHKRSSSEVSSTSEWSRCSEILRTFAELQKLLSDLLHVLAPPSPPPPSDTAIFPEKSKGDLKVPKKSVLKNVFKLQVVGEDMSNQVLPVEEFIPKRIKTIADILNKHPSIKRIINL